MKYWSSIFAAALMVTALPFHAGAQIAPTDTGAGELRGMQDINNSGQVGSATFFPDPKGTKVEVRVRGMREGRIEPLAILRGKSCETVEPTLGWTLAPLIEGRSVTVIAAPIAKVLSGNYVIIAHADDHVSGHNLSCGELNP